MENGTVILSENFMYTPERVAAVTWHLVQIQIERLQRSPMPCDLSAIESVLDSLASIAEFPGVNAV
jgi:hypothetical protein